MKSVIYRLRQEIDKPRSIIGHATVPVELLAEAAERFTAN